jgi:hypothetical protein
MRFVALVALALIGCLIGSGLAGENTKEQNYKQLPRADLEKIEGTWGMTINSSTGWKGTMRAEIRLEDPKGFSPELGTITYDVDMTRGKDEIDKGTGVGRISFAGGKSGKTTVLVRVSNDVANPEITWDKKRIASFVVNGDTLTLNVSESVDAFFVKSIAELKLDWAKLEWKRIKEK